MGRLIVVEGLDGSGKATLTANLAQKWTSQGRTVARLAFPRYGLSVHADLVQDALYGRLGDMSESVYGTALLFALDRRGAADQIRQALADYDLVLLDRYISSNAAYGSARLGGPAEETDFAEWVRALEVDRFGIPVPDLQVLLNVPVALAEKRARGRASSDSSRALDSFESDGGLQRRTAQMYSVLADRNYLSPWRLLSPETDGSITIPADLLGPA